jgi:hypothetical protein
MASAVAGEDRHQLAQPYDSKLTLSPTPTKGHLETAALAAIISKMTVVDGKIAG